MDSQPMEGQAPIVKLTKAIIDQVIIDGKNEFRITAHEKTVEVTELIDGEWTEIMTIPVNLRDPLTRRFKVMAEMDILKENVTQTGKFDWVLQETGYLIQAEATPGEHGEALHFTIFPKPPPLN